jgi:hypothetical protein
MPKLSLHLPHFPLASQAISWAGVIGNYGKRSTWVAKMCKDAGIKSPRDDIFNRSFSL